MLYRTATLLVVALMGITAGRVDAEPSPVLCAKDVPHVTLIQGKEAVSCLKADEPVGASELRGASTDGEYAPFYLGAMLLQPASATAGAEMRGSPEQLVLDLLQMQSPEKLKDALSSSWLPKLLGGCYRRSEVALDAVAVQREPARRGFFQAGDIVFVPDLPEWVAVYGTVRAPGRYPFDAALTARDFVEQAGGAGAGGELGEAFVYTPDGRYLSLAITHWNYEPQRVPPGSIIVVPPWRDQAKQWLAELRDEVDLAPESCE